VGHHCFLPNPSWPTIDDYIYILFDERLLLRLTIMSQPVLASESASTTFNRLFSGFPHFLQENDGTIYHWHTMWSRGASHCVCYKQRQVVNPPPPQQIRFMKFSSSAGVCFFLCQLQRLYRAEWEVTRWLWMERIQDEMVVAYLNGLSR
jgi:hypothetical protein